MEDQEKDKPDPQQPQKKPKVEMTEAGLQYLLFEEEPEK